MALPVVGPAESAKVERLLNDAGIAFLRGHRATEGTDRVAGELSGAQPTEIFAGEGVCYAEVGGGLASGVSGRFLADPPSVAIASPTSDGLAAKQRFETERLAAWFGR